MIDREKFKEIIVDRLGVDPNEITDEASFIDDLGADSLDTVELIMGLRRGVRSRNSRRGRRAADQRG